MTEVTATARRFVRCPAGRTPGSGGERLGIFGGHLRPARTSATWSPPSTSATSCALDRVLLVVSNVPWQKVGTRDDLAGRGTASAMVEAAVADVEGLEASRIEIDAGGPSYTADTLAALLAEDPTRELFVILGADAAAGLAHVGALRGGARPRHDRRRRATRAPHRPTRSPGGGGSAVEVPSLEVSSTDLRARAVDGRPLDYLVTHEVADWIEAHGLYRGDAVTATDTEEPIAPAGRPALRPAAGRRGGG